jgi:hypothetical protein
MLARSAANQGDYTEAQTALRAASRALGTYGQSGGTHAQQVKQLRTEIDNYSQSIQQSHTDASSKIESWWNQLAEMNTPVTAQNQTGNSNR